MKVHFIATDGLDYVLWYDRRGRAWFEAPHHAFVTAGANTGWRLSDYGVACRIAGDMVTTAHPDRVRIAKGQTRPGRGA